MNNWWVYPCFEIDVVASGFNLPVAIAFPPEQRKGKNDVVELYGKVK
ncbi:hypothetical protein [Archaeoglobus fulgidus]|nr:hypothetical protein [Archaeoglobus fulgidus]